MSDLDNDELIATRKLHGQDDGLYRETSDKNVDSIEKDIERCKQLTKSEHANWIGISNQLAIVHILAEREQDKKRIQELEECKIVQDKNIRSGKPVIEGTRLTVIDVLLLMIEFIKNMRKNLEKIMQILVQNK